MFCVVSWLHGCCCRALMHAATICTGPPITYNQPSPDPTQATNQDRIMPNVWLTRAASKGLFNAFSETNATAFSPADTEWAFGTPITTPHSTTRTGWPGSMANLPPTWSASRWSCISSPMTFIYQLNLPCGFPGEAAGLPTNAPPRRRSIFLERASTTANSHSATAPTPDFHMSSKVRPTWWIGFRWRRMSLPPIRRRFPIQWIQQGQNFIAWADCQTLDAAWFFAVLARQKNPGT